MVNEITTPTAKNPLDAHLEAVVNPCWNFAKRLTTWEDHVSNAVVGLAAEAGEVLDVHKKMFYHTPKPYKVFQDQIKQEMGDVCFYLAKLLELHGLTLEEVLAANAEKLQSRHPELGLVQTRFPEGYIK